MPDDTHSPRPTLTYTYDARTDTYTSHPPHPASSAQPEQSFSDWYARWRMAYDLERQDADGTTTLVEPTADWFTNTPPTGDALRAAVAAGETTELPAPSPYWEVHEVNDCVGCGYCLTCGNCTCDMDVYEAEDDGPEFDADEDEDGCTCDMCHEAEAWQLGDDDEADEHEHNVDDGDRR